MSEEAKAVQETAKAAAKALETSEKAGGFVAKYVNYPLVELAGIVGDRLRYSRWERQQRLMQRARDFQERSGKSSPDKTLALKLALPLMAGGSLEESDDLQDLWAALLVNSTSSETNVDAKRIYMDVLERISSFDAVILSKIYEIPYDKMIDSGVVTRDLPKSVELFDFDRAPENKQKLSEPQMDVKLSLMNLVQIGVIWTPKSLGGGESFKRVNPTFLGQQFVRACTPPRAKALPGDDRENQAF